MAVVVLTGCSSGFGLEGALAFARRGDRVYATMRDVGRDSALRRAAAAEGLSLEVRRLDLAEPGTFADALNEIVAEAGRIDVLVNNAGVNQAAAFEDPTEAMLRAVMEVNCVGPLLLARAVLPYMRQQRSGMIIMMSSLSGIAGLPGNVAYSASKFALEGATESLRHEVDRWGIRVALVQAGLYATQLFENSLRPASMPRQDYPPDSPYRPLIVERRQKMLARLPEAFDPRSVGELFVQIASSDGCQMRWPADPVAQRVLSTMLAQDDHKRDEFLRAVADSDWWSRGDARPE